LVWITTKTDAAELAVSDTGFGKKMQLVYTGRFEQLKLTVPTYPPTEVRDTVVLTL